MVRKQKIKKIVLYCIGEIALFSIALLLVHFIVGLWSSPSELGEDVAKRATTVEQYIDKYYWKEDVSDQKLSEYAAKGMVLALGDEYSTYLTEEEYKQMMEGVEGDYSGIGATVQIDQNTKKKTIVELIKGAPAEKAGLKIKDVIIEVDGVNVEQESLDEVIKRIRGENGKKSVLTISREENGKTVTKKITVVCEQIINETITYKMLENSIGYIKISEFDNVTIEQFRTAMEKLEKQGLEKLILDVRNNGGGSLTAVVEMLDILLPKGTLLTEKSKVDGDRVYESDDKEVFDKPMVVMINGISASASEVFAGALQDRDAAELVGEKSYGKGIVQTIFSLEKSCGGGIKLTTGEYLLPSGRSIHKVGLTPDVEEKFTGDWENYVESEDNQLAKAIEVLRG